MKHDAKQYNIDLRDSRKAKHRRLEKNRPKRALVLPLDDEQIRWAALHQTVWFASILQG